MRKLIQIFGAAALITLTITAGGAPLEKSTKVCVSNTTQTRLPQLDGRKGIEIQNRGPNSIHCALGGPTHGDGGTVAVIGEAREIAAGGTWSLGIGPEPIYCLAATAAQTSPACTSVTEVK